MNWIDIGIVALILYQAAIGFRHGVWRGVLDLAALLVALTITITQFTHIAEIIRDLLSTAPAVTRWMSFLGCFGICMAVLNSVVRLISLFVKRNRRSWPNRIGGIFLGSIRGGLLVSFFLVLFTMMPIPSSLSAQLEQSPLAPSILAVVPMMYDTIAPRVLSTPRPFYEQLNHYLALPSASISITTDRSLKS